jgi:hypothetical protein
MIICDVLQNTEQAISLLSLNRDNAIDSDLQTVTVPLTSSSPQLYDPPPSRVLLVLLCSTSRGGCGNLWEDNNCGESQCTQHSRIKDTVNTFMVDADSDSDSDPQANTTAIISAMCFSNLCPSPQHCRQQPTCTGRHVIMMSTGLNLVQERTTQILNRQPL